MLKKSLSTLVPFPAPAEYTLVLSSLLFFTALMHGDVIHAYWRLHDGDLLLFALQYQPLDYFFSPDTIARQSTHLTPWNVLFYDINLFLFGISPRGHYLHMMFLLWVSSALTYMLLRMKFCKSCSFFAAMLFLAGLPTVEAVQQLMSGHYLTGLIFTQLAIFLYLRALEKNNNQFLAIAGGFFYLLATACKEIYVPLFIVLFFINFKHNFKALWPFLLVAILYVLWRFFAVDTFIGGYTPDLNTLNPLQIAREFLSIPFILFGRQWYSFIVIVLLSLLLLHTLIKKELSFSLLIVSVIAVLLPLLPLTIYPGLDSGNNRYFYLLWWGISVLTAIMLSHYTTKRGQFFSLLVGVFILGATVSYAAQYKNNYLIHFLTYGEQHYHFVTAGPDSKADDKGVVFLLVEGKLSNYWKKVLKAMLKAHELENKSSDRKVKIVDLPELYELIKHNKNSAVYQYHLKNKKIEKINHLLPVKFNRLRRHFVKDVDLSIKLFFDSEKLKWELTPRLQGSYKIYFKHVSGHLNVVTVNSEGVIPYPSGARINFYVVYFSPQGWITASPVLSFDSLQSPAFQWQGKSLVP
jgi:hypothetical protein